MVVFTSTSAPPLSPGVARMHGDSDICIAALHPVDPFGQIKLYNPSLALDALKAPDLLLRWLKGVLAEHGLKVDDIYSSTSDSGRDIKHLLSVLLPAEWAWCVPHMANRALNEGMGLNVDPATSKNKEAREEIKKVRSLVEHLNKSPKMAAKFQELCVSLAAYPSCFYRSDVVRESLQGLQSSMVSCSTLSCGRSSIMRLHRNI